MKPTATRKCIPPRTSDEDYRGHVNPIGIRSCYDEGKRCAETLVFECHRQHRLRIKVARIFNTYGPRMHPNGEALTEALTDRGATYQKWYNITPQRQSRTDPGWRSSSSSKVNRIRNPFGIG